MKIFKKTMIVAALVACAGNAMAGNKSLHYPGTMDDQVIKNIELATYKNPDACDLKRTSIHSNEYCDNAMRKGWCYGQYSVFGLNKRWAKCGDESSATVFEELFSNRPKKLDFQQLIVSNFVLLMLIVLVSAAFIVSAINKKN